VASTRPGAENLARAALRHCPETSTEATLRPPWSWRSLVGSLADADIRSATSSPRTSMVTTVRHTPSRARRRQRSTTTSGSGCPSLRIPKGQSTDDPGLDCPIQPRPKTADPVRPLLPRRVRRRAPRRLPPSARRSEARWRDVGRGGKAIGEGFSVASRLPTSAATTAPRKPTGCLRDRASRERKDPPCATRSPRRRALRNSIRSRPCSTASLRMMAYHRD